MITKDSEFVSKRKVVKSYASKWDPRWHPGRRKVIAGENVDFICWFLFNNPGARYTEVLKALCTRNGVKYKPGQYSRYLAKQHWHDQYVDRFWSKIGKGWVLTLEGMARYGNYCITQA